MKKILITGATGFIGNGLIKHFNSENVTVLTRTPLSDSQYIQASLECFLEKKIINELFDTVIHLAGLAHGKNSLAEYREINVDCTLALARQLAQNGLKRFVFISSIGVNGNKTLVSQFTELSSPKPHADYAISKYEAEIALAKLSKELGFELVIIRPPLVYGENAPGNFKSFF
jgi:nucleoside-diphosphate-sugar epimerase